MSKRVHSFILLPLLTLTALAQSQPVLDAPLTIWDVAGVDRKQEICSSGIPLPCGLLKEPEGIAVFDPSGKAVPAQFRVLERWRDAGEGRGDLSIRWLLVTFLADVPAGGSAVYRLKPGQNPAPATPVKAEEKGEGWEMGGVSFKKDFTSPFQLVLTDPDGKEITTRGQDIKWSVWENGPVRACLKAESPTDHTNFGFIAWIYAASGQARWDMTVVLKNTPGELKGPFYFKDFSVIWEPKEIKDGRDFLLGGEWGKPVAGKIEGAGPVYLHQDSDGTDLWETFGKDAQLSPVLDWTKDKSKARAGKPAFRGYRVMAGDKELGAGNFAAGWAALNAGSVGAFAAVRDYHQQYPKVTEVVPGRLVLHLWPRHTQAFGGLHWLDDMTRKWHDLSFQLSATPLTAEQAEACSKALDCPLVACPTPEWNLAAGAYGLSPSRYPPKPFAGGVVKAQPGSGRNWVNFGGDVTDQIRRRYHGADLGGFARTASPGQAYNLHRTAGHSGGMTPLWLDDYQYPRDMKMLNHAQYCSTVRGQGKYRENTWHHGYMSWNHAHFCAQEIFDAWRIFGDPLALDAIRKIGIFCQSYVDFREGGGGLGAGTRADGLPFLNLAEAYRITGDESMRKSLDRMADVSWKQVNKDRGNYGVMDSWEGGKENIEKPFMMAQVMQGVRAYYELTGSERARDQILGMVDFIVSEGSLGKWGFNYVIPIDSSTNAVRFAEVARKMDEDPKSESQKNVSYGHISWIMAWAYQHSGEARFRQAIDNLSSKAYPHTSWAFTQHYPERTDQTPPEAVRDLAVKALGGGRVKLSWTTPAGDPAQYQVKWAERPMVERLNYPDEKDSRANWWSANPVAGEPKPGAAGTKESMTVEDVTPGKRTFAIRSFDTALNRSALSNLVEAEVR